MKALATCALITVASFSQVIQAQTGSNLSLSASFETVSDTLGPLSVSVSYTGTTQVGKAVATYVDTSGNEIVDEMEDCRLNLSADRTTISCTNPHFHTWDHIYYDYHSYSERVTDGVMQVWPITSGIRQSMRYVPRSSD